MSTPVEIIQLRGAEGNRLVADRVGPWPRAAYAVLAHGGGQTRHAWGGTCQDLAEAGVTAVALDQRGHGDSSWVDTGAYAFEDYAADLARVVANLAPEAGGLPVLIGASLGGLASLLALGEGMTEARALILVDVTPRMRPSGVDKVQGFMAERAAEGFATLEEAADAIARYLPHRPRPTSLDGLRKNLRVGQDGRWRWHWDPRFLRGPRTVNHAREDMERRFTDAARRLTVPTLLVRGMQSELVGAEEAAAFRALTPHASVVEVAHARHMVAGDANDAFTGAIRRFIADL